MSKLGLIIGREYGTRVKKKSFILMTILGPLLFAGLMVVAIWVAQADTTKHKVLVVDQAGVLTFIDTVRNGTLPTYPDIWKGTDDLQYRFTSTFPEDSVFMQSEFTLILNFDETVHQERAELLHKKTPSKTVVKSVESTLEKAVERNKVKQNLNIAYDEYKRLKVNINLQSKSLTDKGNKGDNDIASLVGMAMAVMIFMFIFLYGAQVMRGVIEEKSNRIIEVIVSSVKPFQLMMGKIIGIGLVGLTQFVIWIVLSMVLFTVVGVAFEQYGQIDEVQAIVNNQGSMTQQIPIDFETYLASNEKLSFLIEFPWTKLIVFFLLFFMGGYLLYGSLFAAIGAAVDNETDTQQFMMPAMLPLMFSYFLAIMAINNPEGIAARIFSHFPLSSPIVMMVRVPEAPIWELILSIVVLLLTAVFFIWIAGKIYRVGILMYGKKPSYKEVAKWIFFKS